MEGGSGSVQKSAVMAPCTEPPERPIAGASWTENSLESGSGGAEASAVGVVCTESSTEGGFGDPQKSVSAAGRRKVWIDEG